MRIRFLPPRPGQRIPGYRHVVHADGTVYEHPVWHYRDWNRLWREANAHENLQRYLEDHRGFSHADALAAALSLARRIHSPHRVPPRTRR